MGTGQVSHLGIVGATISGSHQELLQLVSVLGIHTDYLAIDLGMIFPASEVPTLLRMDAALQHLVTDVVRRASLLPAGGPRVFLRVPTSWNEATMLPTELHSAIVAVGTMAL